MIRTTLAFYLVGMLAACGEPGGGRGGLGAGGGIGNDRDVGPVDGGGERAGGDPSDGEPDPDPDDPADSIEEPDSGGEGEGPEEDEPDDEGTVDGGESPEEGCGNDDDCEPGEVCSLEGECVDAPIEDPPPNQADWALLVYIAADNNLDPFAAGDLEELRRAGADANVQVLVQVDRTEQSYPGEEDFDEEWSDTRRLRLEGDRWVVEERMGEVDMADPLQLEEFVDWGLESTDARRVALVLWDHGAGWLGFGGDDDNFGPPMDIPSVRRAIEAGQRGRRLDLVGFDACLMSTIEVAWELREVADVFVASQELEPGAGWNYARFMHALRQSPQSDGAALGSLIVESFQDFYLGLDRGDPDPTVTLAAVDLEGLREQEEAIIDGVDALAQMLVERQDVVTIARARAVTQFYGGRDLHLVDFVQFVRQIGQLAPNRGGGALADLEDALTSAVLHEEHGIARPFAAGISVYFPPRTPWASAGARELYRALAFVSDTGWDRALTAFDAALADDESLPVVFEPTLAYFDGGVEATAEIMGGEDAVTAVALMYWHGGGDSEVVTALPARIRGDTIMGTLPFSVPTLTDGVNDLRVPLLYELGSWLAYDDGDAVATLARVPLTLESPFFAGEVSVELLAVQEREDRVPLTVAVYSVGQPSEIPPHAGAILRGRGGGDDAGWRRSELRFDTLPRFELDNGEAGQAFDIELVAHDASGNGVRGWTQGAIPGEGEGQRCEANDECQALQFCEAGGCFDSLPGEVFIRLDSLTLGPRDPEGRAWDAIDGSAPDPLAELSVDERPVWTSETQRNTYEMGFARADGVVAFLRRDSEILLCAWDMDIADHDFAGCFVWTGEELLADAREFDGYVEYFMGGGAPIESFSFEIGPVF